jgi:hypothetical protein
VSGRTGPVNRYRTPPVRSGRSGLKTLARTSWLTTPVGTTWRTDVEVAVQAGLTKPPADRFPRIKKPGGLPVKPTGLPFLRICRHGFGVGIRPVHVPGRTGSTGNQPNRPGSHRFCEPWVQAFRGGRRCEERKVRGVQRLPPAPYRWRSRILSSSSPTGCRCNGRGRRPPSHSPRGFPNRRPLLSGGAPFPCFLYFSPFSSF